MLISFRFLRAFSDDFAFEDTVAGRGGDTTDGLVDVDEDIRLIDDFPDIY